jgi:hypothetical protein
LPLATEQAASEGNVKIVLLIAVLTLVGCTPENMGREQLDQCIRWQLFQQCMAALPAGPVQAKYNDWDEVVSQCESTASRAAYRIPELVPDTCKGHK